MRKILFRVTLVFPWSVSAVLSVLAVYPVLFRPSEQLTATLAALVGAGLSFASVGFAASTARAAEAQWSARMSTAALEMLQFSMAMSVALSLNVARERLVANLAGATAVDYMLRGLMATVSLVAMGLVFLAFRSMVVLFGATLERQPDGAR